MSDRAQLRFAISIPSSRPDGTFDPGACRPYLARAEAPSFDSAHRGGYDPERARRRVPAALEDLYGYFGMSAWERAPSPVDEVGT